MIPLDEILQKNHIRYKKFKIVNKMTDLTLIEAHSKKGIKV